MKTIKKKTIKHASLWLLALSTSVLTAYQQSAELSFESRLSLDKPAPSNKLDIERVRLDFEGKLAPYWQYHLRVQINEFDNDQIGLDPEATFSRDTLPWYPSVPVSMAPQITQVYTIYSQIDGILLRAGLISSPEISSQQLYYKPFTQGVRLKFPIGVVQNATGNHMGTAYSGYVYGFGYDFGVWCQTPLRKIDTVQLLYSNLATGSYQDLTSLTTQVVDDYTGDNFDTKKLRMGIGARLSYAYEYAKGAHIGFAAGYNQAPLNMAILLNVVGSYSGATQPSDRPAVTIYTQNAQRAWLSSTTFKDLTQFALDSSYVFHNVQVGAGFQYQKVAADLYKVPTMIIVVDGDAVPQEAHGARLELFRQDGGASGYWFEGGYLLSGGNYAYNKKSAVVSGVSLRNERPAFEIVGRYGAHWYSNVLALVTPQGWQDWAQDVALRQATVATVDSDINKLLVISVDNTDANPNKKMGGKNTDAFNERVRGFMVGFNCHMSSRMTFKLSYEQRLYDFKRQGEEWQPSVDPRSAQIRAGLDCFF